MQETKHSFWPSKRLRQLENFGHSMSEASYVYRPTHIEQVQALFETAAERGTPVTFRGAGRSYGDASLNTGGVVIDTQRMNRILSWNPETGVIYVEPGVTIQQIWQHVLEDGWWPPVVPGTMYPTIGGCLGTNIHGKNNWKKGPIGEHVVEFTALLPNGELLVCSPTQNSELFYAMIGGLGMLGMFSAVGLQMQRIYSGDVWVDAWTEPNLAQSMASIDSLKEENDYIVGWIDCTVQGQQLGRSQLHAANYLQAGEDPAPLDTLRTSHQVLPDTLLKVIPKSVLYRLMTPFMNNIGVRMTNGAKFYMNKTVGTFKRHLNSLVAFNFLLDYVPNWERAYGKGGMFQYQCFIPKQQAQDAFTEIIRLGLRHRLPNYLGVLKRHRPDSFLLTHSVDGFSFAQDYRVTRRNRARLRRLMLDLDAIVLDAGGRFYFAKDSTLSQAGVQVFMGRERIQQFQTLKANYDPLHILESNLYRRCFGEWRGCVDRTT